MALVYVYGFGIRRLGDPYGIPYASTPKVPCATFAPDSGSAAAAQGAGARAGAASSGLSRRRRPVRTMPPASETQGSGPGVRAVLGAA